jgi:antitoxin HicB
MNKTIDYYLSLPYEITLRPLSEEEGGGWLASVPLLQGCVTDGDTQAEALARIEELKHALLELAIEKGRAIPEPEKHPA